MTSYFKQLLRNFGPAHRMLSRYRGVRIHEPNKNVATKRFGSEYGGWHLIQDYLSETSIVYSFGIGSDISFDLELISAYDCEVFGFDPTPTAREWIRQQKLPQNFRYIPLALSASDGELEFLVPEVEGWNSFGITDENTPREKIIRCAAKSLATIAKELEHSHIDLIKMDIEGFEYDVIRNISNNQLRPKQFLVEFHHGMYNISKSQTKEAVERLISLNYQLIHVSNVGREYTFVQR